MRISDWSSDVCSSDLHPLVRPGQEGEVAAQIELALFGVIGMRERVIAPDIVRPRGLLHHQRPAFDALDRRKAGGEMAAPAQFERTVAIGRAACRERV